MRLGLLLCFTAALLSFAAPSAQANFVLAPELSITVTNADDSSQSGTWSTGTGTDGNLQEWDNVNVWTSDHSTLLAHFDYIQVQNNNDPMAGVFFGVVAGASPTNFTISSGVVSFAPLVNPNNATASASVTVTDFNSNGASLTGNYAGPLSFHALYNGGTLFKALVGPDSTGPNGSSSVSDGPYIANIPGVVTSIESVFSFQLSAHDFGSGSGVFTIPEPSSVCLAAVGAAGLAFFARRRRRA
jgi:MYXO-CTERM domain-containing protein